ncbi:MAG: hypothetical protein ACLPY1_24595 [Terracidiphilus sp.]
MHSDKQPMSARIWLMEAIGVTVLLLIAVALLNMSLDIYGIFRNPQGRHLVVYGDERVAKYLLSERYVPANFNALLIGSSVSANWNTSGIEALRVYNESINGGNIVEEKAVADQALPSSRIRAVLLIVHPYLTSSHEFETVQLTPRENLAALGSQSLLDAYKSDVRIKLHLERPELDEFGTDDFGDIPQKMNPHLQKLMTPGTEFTIDEPAMASYRALVDEFHASNIRIIYVIPPVLQSIYLSKAAAFANYSRAAMENKREGDQVIDFTSDEFVDFRSNPGNFKDGVHLTNESARQVVATINARINQWIQNGQLPSFR